MKHPQHASKEHKDMQQCSNNTGVLRSSSNVIFHWIIHKYIIHPQLMATLK